MRLGGQSELLFGPRNGLGWKEQIDSDGYVGQNSF